MYVQAKGFKSGFELDPIGNLVKGQSSSMMSAA